VATVGHAIEPVIRPLGFDWKIGVGLITSMAAREVIISTLGTLHGVDAQSHATDLQAALRQELTPAGAVALLVSSLSPWQCMSTLPSCVAKPTAGSGPSAVLLHDRRRLYCRSPLTTSSTLRAIRLVQEESVGTDLARERQQLMTC